MSASSDRDRLRRAFDESYDLRPEPGLRHRAIQHAVSRGRRDRTPRAWGFAVAAALALLVVGALMGPRLLQRAETTPAGRPSAKPVPTASAPVPPGPSPQLFRGALAADPASGRAVLFGSPSADSANGQTWTWDGAHWTPVPGAQPPARTMAAAAYDGHGVVLFGGQGVPSAGQTVFPNLGDTWTFSGQAWTQAHPAASPGPTAAAVMAWDPALGRAVLVAEEPSGVQTWTWDGAAWSQSHPAHTPSSVFGAALGYDPAGRRLVLFGRIIAQVGPTPDAGSTTAWSFDGQDWTMIPGAPDGPVARTFATLADDGAHLYLFGGSDAAGQALGDTWEWQGSGWQRLTPAHRPPGRQEARMAPGQGVVVLYGGATVENQTSLASLADTWVFDGRDWTQKAG